MCTQSSREQDLTGTRMRKIGSRSTTTVQHSTRNGRSNRIFTVGASFGAERELSFLHVSHGTTLSFPQQNGMAFSFGRDVNLRFQHGIRALPPQKQANIKGAVEAKGGRISIVLWGWVTAEDEHDENSPPMLTDETRGGSGNAQAHRGGNRGRGGARGSSDSSPKSPATPPQ